MRQFQRMVLGVLLAVLVLAAPAVRPLRAEPAVAKAKLKVYDAKYYTVQTDLDIETVREAVVRLMAMAETYNERTKGFSGRMRSKMPFYLFSSVEDYQSAGGLPGSAGIYNGRALMAVASKPTGGRLWQVVQHEGFHQFAHKTISGRLPIWVNEGMAEYFGEALWTGDGMVTGAVPPGRLKRLKLEIEAGGLLSFDDMIDMSHEQWNRQLNFRNYDQAWAMVHFLAHGDDEKYQKLFVTFMREISRGGAVKTAWQRRFGRDTEAFEKRFADWWKSQGENPTRELYVRAAFETLTSYLARATFKRMKFESVEQFFAAAREGKLTFDPKTEGKIWLPASLLEGALQSADPLREWSLEGPGHLPRLKLSLDDGTTFTGRFLLARNGVRDVTVTVTKVKPAPTPTPASGPANP